MKFRFLLITIYAIAGRSTSIYNCMFLRCILQLNVAARTVFNLISMWLSILHLSYQRELYFISRLSFSIVRVWNESEIQFKRYKRVIIVYDVRSVPSKIFGIFPSNKTCTNICLGIYHPSQQMRIISLRKLKNFKMIDSTQSI